LVREKLALKDSDVRGLAGKAIGERSSNRAVGIIVAGSHGKLRALSVTTA
jgi:hypothetical protein